jgi:hypothetical protein
MGNLVIHRCVAVLNVPDSVPHFISYSKGIVLAMTDNPDFTTPSPTLASVTTHIKDLEDADSVAQTGVRGSIGRRDEKQAIVLKDLHSLQSYVQGIADNNPDRAKSIITGAGMSVKQEASKVKSDFSAKRLSSGVVQLTAKAVASRAAYQWQSSTDEKTWTTIRTTLQCSTIVDGLTPGETYYFRFCSTTSEGTGDWSQIISIISL